MSLNRAYKILINKNNKKMAALERVMQLKDQGIPESQIIDSLKQEGISPKEIDEALSQSKIKSALNTNEIPQPAAPPGMQTSSIAQPVGQQEIQPIQQTQMQPSMTLQSQESTQPNMAPQPQELMQPIQEQMPMTQSQQIPIAQSQQIPQPYQTTAPYVEPAQYPMSVPAPYPKQYEEDYPEYQPQQPADIETINDIAEQIAEEKNVKLKKQISSLARFKDEINSETKRIGDRLTKIEGVFNELQIAVLRKIGDYGKDIQNIAKEMHITQDSFSKILSPLTENIKELKKITNKEEHITHHETPPTPHEPIINKKTKSKKPIETSKPKKRTSRKTKKHKPKIEDYVR